VLSAVSVFDRDCGSVHVQEKNEVAFRPFGLDIPDDLAGICQALKQKLGAEETQLNAARDPVFDKPRWNPATPVGAIMSALSHDTDFAALEKLGEMSTDERARLARLDEDLLKNPADAAAEQRLFAGNVRQLIATLDRLAAAYGDEKLAGMKTLADAARDKRAAADFAARETFDGLSIPGVGGKHGGRYGRPPAAIRTKRLILARLSRPQGTKPASCVTRRCMRMPRTAWGASRHSSARMPNYKRRAPSKTILRLLPHSRRGNRTCE
jgi:hypothetical protein